MKFKVLATYMEKLENTSSRNRMIAMLADIFKLAGVEEIKSICYLILGQIYPNYVETTLGLGGKMVQSAIALAASKEEKAVETAAKELGDLGLAAAAVIKTRRNTFKKFFKPEGELSVKEVHQTLKGIAEAGGEGSQEVKKKTLAALLSEGSKLERKYIARLAAGAMRLGLGDMTILDALAVGFLSSKEKKPELERAYNVCSDIGEVAEVLIKRGLPGVKKIKLSLNRPIKPMLAQRVSRFSEIKEKIGSENISVEEKYDGERIQAHKAGKKVVLFSRRMIDVTNQFPEIVENVRKNIKAEEVILDGEAVAYDFREKTFSPFQKLMRRRRKYGVQEFSKKIPVKYIVFDLIYLNGKILLKENYPFRRKFLEKIVKKYKYLDLAGRMITPDLEEAEEFFQDCLERKLEGIVCKSCAENSYYRAGAREWAWIKWKKEYASRLSDTLDLVVVGAYKGRGSRAGTYGSLLCAAYDKEKDVFQTVTRLGAGFSEEDLESMMKRLNDFREDSKPARVEALKEVEPDVWFAPEMVVEVLAAEITRSSVHTCAREYGKGLALRFPRFKRWRSEKNAEQATLVREIKDMYEAQGR